MLFCNVILNILDALSRGIFAGERLGVIVGIIVFVLVVFLGLSKSGKTEENPEEPRVLSQSELQKENRGCLIFVICIIITAVLFFMVSA